MYKCHDLQKKLRTASDYLQNALLLDGFTEICKLASMLDSPSCGGSAELHADETATTTLLTRTPGRARGSIKLYFVFTLAPPGLLPFFRMSLAVIVMAQSTRPRGELRSSSNTLQRYEGAEFVTCPEIPCSACRASTAYIICRCRQPVVSRRSDAPAATFTRKSSLMSTVGSNVSCF